ncbi:MULTISPECIES: hypothetical protein [Aerosakkonema]|uniref:hypothetical protein n=1 Tax=Aerosakkonema TaxID=1246629 RepID=UPI0035B967B7
MPIYRKQAQGFTRDGRYRLGELLLNARMRQDEGHGLSLDDFVELINEYHKKEVIGKNKLWRLETASVVKPKAEDLAYLAPFTWSESAERPYTVEELVAIAKEQLDPADVGKVRPPDLNLDKRSQPA